MIAGRTDRQSDIIAYGFVSGTSDGGNGQYRRPLGLPAGVSSLTGVYPPAVCCRRWLVLWAWSLPTCSTLGIDSCRHLPWHMGTAGGFLPISNPHWRLFLYCDLGREVTSFDT